MDNISRLDLIKRLQVAAEFKTSGECIDNVGTLKRVEYIFINRAKVARELLKPQTEENHKLLSEIYFYNDNLIKECLGII